MTKCVVALMLHIPGLCNGMHFFCYLSLKGFDPCDNNISCYSLEMFFAACTISKFSHESLLNSIYISYH